MFKKFTTEEVSTQNQIKSSVQRGVRGALDYNRCVCISLIKFRLNTATAGLTNTLDMTLTYFLFELQQKCLSYILSLNRQVS